MREANALASSRLTAWIGAPSLRNAGALLDQFARDACVLLRPFGVDHIWTNEPRFYRMTPLGLDLLSEAFDARCCGYIDFGAKYPVQADANMIFTLGSVVTETSPVYIPEIAVVVFISFLPEISVSTSSDVAAFVQKWFVSFGAASAFVSLRPDEKIDGKYRTVHEESIKSHLTDWSDMLRYARGAFWGNALGEGLCNRLGGRERVLREAPVYWAKRLGDGVWLQLSETPPAPIEEIDRLTAYLAPLLDWSSANLARAQWSSRQVPRFRETIPQPIHSGVAVVAGTPGQRVSLEMTEDHLEWEDDPVRDAQTDVSFNVYLTHVPTAEQLEALQVTLTSWVQDGQQEKFSGARFRGFAGDYSANGRVVRWYIEMFVDTLTPAIENLRERLAAIPSMNVEKLVLGTETVG